MHHSYLVINRKAFSCFMLYGSIKKSMCMGKYMNSTQNRRWMVKRFSWTLTVSRGGCVACLQFFLTSCIILSGKKGICESTTRITQIVTSKKYKYQREIHSCFMLVMFVLGDVFFKYCQRKKLFYKILFELVFILNYFLLKEFFPKML